MCLRIDYRAQRRSILVLKNGELVEQGRYAELVRQGGLFAELDASGRFVPDAMDEPDSEVERAYAAGERRGNSRHLH